MPQTHKIQAYSSLVGLHVLFLQGLDILNETFGPYELLFNLYKEIGYQYVVFLCLQTVALKELLA